MLMNVMPSGTSNEAFACPARAAFMKSVQMGSAAVEPLRREADEPRIAEVVRGAALAGGIEGEAVGARRRSGAFVEDAAHHVGDEIRRVTLRDVPQFRRSGLQRFRP